MKYDEDRKKQALTAIAEAAERLGLSCVDGVVWISLGYSGFPVDEVNETEIDCTAADPKHLLDYITAELYRQAYKKGEEDALGMVRSVIGAAPAKG